MCKICIDYAKTCQRKQLYTSHSKKHCTNAPAAMAKQSVINARQIGLNVFAGDKTSGDGNCFYHGLLKQIRGFKNTEFYDSFNTYSKPYSSVE